MDMKVSPAAAATVPITYIEPNGTEHKVDAEIGKNLMQVAHDNNIELEGASCVLALHGASTVVGKYHIMCLPHRN
jgi:hypothetical protein